MTKSITAVATALAYTRGGHQGTRHMSAEFDDFVRAVHQIHNEVKDARLFSIAERLAIQLLLDGINRANEKFLRRGER